MVERRDSKVPKDLREEASAASRKDPRRDSFQMTMPAIVADLTRELGKLKKRISELEKDLERETTARVKAEAKADEAQRRPAPEKSDEVATRMTRELRAVRKSMIPRSAAQTTPPRGSVNPTAATQPPPRSERSTKRIAAVTRAPSQPPERKR